MGAPLPRRLAPLAGGGAACHSPCRGLPARLLGTGAGQVPPRLRAAGGGGGAWPGGRPAGGAAIGRSGNEPHVPRWQGVRPRSSVTEGDLRPVQDLTGLASKRPWPGVPSPPPAFGDAIFGGAPATSAPAETGRNLQAATMVQNVILVFFRRRLSQRPAVEELERRNILKREYWGPLAPASGGEAGGGFCPHSLLCGLGAPRAL